MGEGSMRDCKNKVLPLKLVWRLSHRGTQYTVPYPTDLAEGSQSIYTPADIQNQYFAYTTAVVGGRA